MNKSVVVFFLPLLIKIFSVFVKLLCLAEGLTLVGVQRCSISMDLLLKNVKNKWLRYRKCDPHFCVCGYPWWRISCPSYREDGWVTFNKSKNVCSVLCLPQALATWINR